MYSRRLGTVEGRADDRWRRCRSAGSAGRRVPAGPPDHLQYLLHAV